MSLGAGVLTLAKNKTKKNTIGRFYMNLAVLQYVCAMHLYTESPKKECIYEYMCIQAWLHFLALSAHT